MFFERMRLTTARNAQCASADSVILDEEMRDMSRNFEREGFATQVRRIAVTTGLEERDADRKSEREKDAFI